MSSLRIETEGLSLSEVLELAAAIQEIDGVESAKFTPFLPGEPHFRAHPMMLLDVLHVLVQIGSKTASIAGPVVVGAVSKDVYEKVKTLVGRKADASPEASVRLYDAYGQLIDERKRR